MTNNMSCVGCACVFAVPGWYYMYNIIYILYIVYGMWKEEEKNKLCDWTTIELDKLLQMENEWKKHEWKDGKNERNVKDQYPIPSWAYYVFVLYFVILLSPNQFDLIHVQETRVNTNFQDFKQKQNETKQPEEKRKIDKRKSCV